MPDGGRIELRGLRLVGTHGVLAEEQERAQPFEVDLDLSVARLIAERGNVALSMAEPTNAKSFRGNLNGAVNMRVTLVGVELNYHL